MTSTNQTSSALSFLPITFGILFMILMIYLGVISTPKARDHYRSKKLMRSIQQIGRIRLGPGLGWSAAEPQGKATKSLH